MIIHKHHANNEESQRLFSILIPSWNNLSYLKLCVESIKKNSHFNHQIILHINNGSDGTLDWAKKEDLDYTHTKENIGICMALNEAATLAHTEYIVYMNDDMYALPEWDLKLWEEINQLPDDQFFLSSTMIEPSNSGNPCVIYNPDFGDTVENFKENKILNDFQSLTKRDWAGSTWPPNIVSKRMWHQIGGYSIEFSPGMTSDPDFSMKLWMSGVRYFKGVGNSKVFHFQCKSTGRVEKNNGKKQFLLKWKISVKNFVENYLKRGDTFIGKLEDKPLPSELSIKEKIKIFFNK